MPSPGHRAARTVRLLVWTVRGLFAAALLVVLLAGLPFALIYGVGWPLPDHVPSLDELEALLLTTMSSTFLLNTLACVAWLLWTVFVLDVAACALDIVRGARWPHPAGPVRRVAAALVGTLLIAVVSRTATAAPATNAHVETAGTLAESTAPTRETSADPGTERVRPVEHGVHDSLWRIASRCLGDGARWPEIWALNDGSTQPGGRVLTNPNLIHPGDILSLPTPAAPSAPSLPAVPSPASGHGTGTPTAPAPAPARTPAPSPSAPASGTENPDDTTGPGLNLVTGAFISAGLASAVAAAVVSARIRRRRRYRAGSGDREDLQKPTPPVVRAIHTAQQRELEPAPAEADVVDLSVLPTRENGAAGLPPHAASRPVISTELGVKVGREVVLDLARAKGIGLVGPGAADAARALLLHALAAAQLDGNGRVVVPADDVRAVLDDVNPPRALRNLVITPSLDAALTELEADLLSRTRHLAEEHRADADVQPIVLLATPRRDAERRLQSLLDNGSEFGLAGVLLGQWRPGVTFFVRHDGTVSASSPGPGERLIGTRLFSLPAQDAADLLEVLQDARPRTHSDVPERELEAADPARDVRDVPAATEEDGGDSAPSPVQLVRSSPPAPAPSPETSASAIADASRLVACTGQESRPAGQNESSPRASLRIQVLGGVEMTFHDEAGSRALQGTLTPKQREVLVYLAVHPQGVRREVLNEAVWPDSRPPRPYNSFHNTLSTLRRAINEATAGAVAKIVRNEDGRYKLDAELIAVDLWELRRALRHSRNGGNEPQSAQRRIADLYQGDLAEDLLAAWVEPFRESIRRDVLDVLGALVSSLGTTDPTATFALLEHMRTFDRYNEGVYREIMRAQARDGQHTAIPRTLALLSATLNEIDEEPDIETLNLARSLQREGSQAS